MANEEHLKILEQGVDAWNEWRRKFPDIQPDIEEPYPGHKNLIHFEVIFGIAGIIAIIEVLILFPRQWWRIPVIIIFFLYLIRLHYFMESVHDEYTLLIALSLIIVIPGIRAVLFISGYIQIESDWWVIPILVLNGLIFIPLSFQTLNKMLKHICQSSFKTLKNYLWMRKFHRMNYRLGGKLQGVNLTGAKLSYVDLDGVDLSNADLREAILINANLHGAILCRTDLSKAILSYTNLTRAYIENAKMDRARLWNSNLKGANLKGARNLTFEQLSQAILDETTILPDGTYWQPPDEGADEEA